MFLKLASLIPLRRGSTCDACGSDFRCGVSLAGCWCSEIKLSDEARAEMRSRYRGCVCRQCLERLSEPPAVADGLMSHIDSGAIAEDQPPATAGGSDVDNPR
jgi:hypothetical protein